MSNFLDKSPTFLFWVAFVNQALLRTLLPPTRVVNWHAQWNLVTTDYYVLHYLMLHASQHALNIFVEQCKEYLKGSTMPLNMPKCMPRTFLVLLWHKHSVKCKRI